MTSFLAVISRIFGPAMRCLAPLWITACCSAGANITFGPFADGISHSSARLYWETNAPSIFFIKYGLTSAYGNLANPPFIPGLNPGKAHSTYLSGLAASTVYHYSVCSSDGSFPDICSADAVFTTSALPAPHPVDPELPRYQVDTTMPAQTGQTLTVGSDCEDPNTGLIAMWNRANWGDTVVVPIATVCSGAYTFPVKARDTVAPHRWIVTRTSASDLELPLPGTRITPAFASKMPAIRTNVMSPYIDNLALLSQYKCSPGSYFWALDQPGFQMRQCSAQSVWSNVIPHAEGTVSPTSCSTGDWFYNTTTTRPIDGVSRCVGPNTWARVPIRWPSFSANAAINLSDNGAHHLRFIGLTITHIPQPPEPLWGTTLGVEVGSIYGALIYQSSVNDHIIWDRCWFQGHEPARINDAGFFDGSYIAVVDSRFDGIQYWQGGLPQVQDVESSGITITQGPGPGKFDNNYIEAYGISLYSTDDANSYSPTPSDYTITRNTFYRDEAYHYGSPASNGRTYITRHLLEMKRGIRWLIQGNLFDGNWASVNNAAAIMLSPQPGPGMYLINIVNGTATTAREHFLTPGAHIVISSTGTSADAMWTVGSILDDRHFTLVAGAAITSGGGFANRLDNAATISDITIRDNIFQRVNSGVYLFGHSLGGYSGTVQNPSAGRVTIKNNIFRNMDSSRAIPNGAYPNGIGGVVLYASLGSEDLQFRHNTMYGNAPNTVALDFDPTPTPGEGFAATDNLLYYSDTGGVQVYGAYFGTDALNRAWVSGNAPSWVFSKNVFAKSGPGPASAPYGPYPPLNIWHDLAVAPVPFKNPAAGDYSLTGRYTASDTCYGAKGDCSTDHTDVGVNMSELITPPDAGSAPPTQCVVTAAAIVSAGTPVTLTESLSSSVGSITGTTQFLDFGVSIGTSVVSSGMSSLSVILPSGLHTITAQYGGDALHAACISTAISVLVSSLTVTGTVTFLKTDTVTQGNWRGNYGKDGYNVIGDPASNPSYVNPIPAGQSAYVWAGSSADPRVLQKPSNPTDRVAGTWYSPAPYTIDLNMSDQAQHQVALYFLDWDSTTRRQTIDVLDANGSLLNTQSLTSSFNGGVYLVWNVSGHVKFRITLNSGANSVMSGLFFGAGVQQSPPQTIASFSGTPQSTTVGTTLGAALQAKVTDASSNPVSGATVTFAAPASGASATFNGANSVATVTNSSGIAISPVPVANNVAGTYTMTASVAGVVTPAAFTLTNSAAVGAATATFIKRDTVTQGNWRGNYGKDGYNVIGDVANNPLYVNPAAVGQFSYLWAGSSLDPRALQKGSNPSDRIAATWYSPAPYTIDLNMSDQAPHQVALYCLDWDSATRRETVDVLDANGNVLNSQTLTASFNGGVYLVWTVSGHVKIRVTPSAGNGVASGLFFGTGVQQLPPQAVAAVVGTPQSTTVGAAFGTALQAKVTDASSNPVSGVTVTFTGPASGAGAMFNGSNLVTAVTNTSGIAASPVPVANNVTGTYTVTAAVTGLTSAAFTLTNNNAAVGAATATFLKTDTVTKGNWRGTYGKDGYNVIGDLASNPSYVTPIPTGQFTYVWAGSSVDPRVLQKASNPADRIAGTWYSPAPYTIDLNMSDQAQHQVALYCLDWDSTTRRQTVDVLDANGNVLNSQSLPSSFNGGAYLVWNVSGHVKFRITVNSGANAVVSGLFFGAN